LFRKGGSESRDGVAVDENTIAVQEEIDFVEGSEKRDALVVQERGKREPRAESRDGVAVQKNVIVAQEEIEVFEGSEKLEVRGEKRDALVVQERGKREPRAESRDGVAVDENTIAVQEEIEVVEEIKEVVVEESENREARAESRDAVTVHENGIAAQEKMEVVEEVKEEVAENVAAVKEVVAEEVVEMIEEEPVENEIIEKVVAEEVVEEVLVNVELSDNKVKIMRPWHIVSEVGIKYPIVDIDNPVPGSLVPSQRFFPSYTAGLGFGRSFGRFSAELGVSAALYQFKLGEVVDQESIDNWGAQVNGELQDAVLTSEEQFVINKFATLSPYLRTQYSIPFKKSWQLGLHALFAINSIQNLPNQFESDQIASSNTIDELSVFDFNPFANSGNPAGNGFISDEGNRSMNLDVGLSLEKTFADRGRLALDMSYTLATGYLERGRYTAFRESSFASGGTYMISGKGPVVRLRYYLHFGKTT